MVFSEIITDKKNSKIETEYNSQLLSNTKKIMQNLKFGIELPILPKFKKYIKRNIKKQNAKSIIIKAQDEKNPVGHVLIFPGKEGLLFFGFFKAKDDSEEIINKLIQKINDYAKKENYRGIRGPINIPTTIFGWGFSHSTNSDLLFLGCPNSSQIYNIEFKKNGFSLKYKEIRYLIENVGEKDGIQKLPDHVKNRYHIFHPNLFQLLKYAPQSIDLHKKYMPKSVLLNPNTDLASKDYIQFVRQFGDKSLFTVIIEKSTQKLVGTGMNLPNVYDGNKKYRSLSIHDFVLHPDHHGKGLSTALILGEKDKRLKYGYVPTSDDNFACKKACEKHGGKIDQIHLIYEKFIK